MKPSECNCWESGYGVCLVCRPELGTDAAKWNNAIADRLEEFLLDAKHAYYCTDKPLMSDQRYDMLEKQLRKLRPTSRVLNVVGCEKCYKKEVQVYDAK